MGDNGGLFFRIRNICRTAISIRRISEIAYHRILAAANVTSTSIYQLQSTEAISALVPLAVAAPKDAFRKIIEIPPGAGYIPKNAELNIYESAALQERARADHRNVLKRISELC